MSAHYITNSERSTAACPQRWLLRYGLSLRTEGRVYCLDVGSFVHEGLEALFESYESIHLAAYEDMYKLPLVDAVDAIDNALATINRNRLAEVCRIKGSVTSSDGTFDPTASHVDPGDIELVNDAATTAIALLKGYHSRWQNDLFTTIRNESIVKTMTITPNGNRSTRTGYTGKVDKVVEYRGRLFLMEHKSTSTPLDEWLEKHRRSAQARSYAFALRAEGIDVEGVIYDLIQSKPPRPWGELGVLKDGSRLAKPKGLPWTTAALFAEAVMFLHGSFGSFDWVDGTQGCIRAIIDAHKKPESVEWYADVYARLAARDADGFWYRREVELFEPGEIDRTASEIYTDATKIRRWKERTKPYRDDILAAAPQDVPAMVEDALHEIGHEFTRQAQEPICWQWRRLCPYASLCHSHSMHDVNSFRIERAPGGHAELVTEAS